MTRINLDLLEFENPRRLQLISSGSVPPDMVSCYGSQSVTIFPVMSCCRQSPSTLFPYNCLDYKLIIGKCKGIYTIFLFLYEITGLIFQDLPECFRTYLHLIADLSCREHNCLKTIGGLMEECTELLLHSKW